MKKSFRKTASVMLAIVMVVMIIPFGCISVNAAYNYLFPVNNGGAIAFGYGYSESYGGTHNGIDIHSSGDDTIYAACDGVVEATANSCPHVSIWPTKCEHYNTFGNYIRIGNSDGTKAYYGHLKQNSLLVSAGQSVKRGQAIASMGSSGYSSGKHLHFELRKSNYSTTINTNPSTIGGEMNYSYSGYGGSGTGDLGDGFYALITHMASWNHLTNESDGNVDICWENYTANQYWKFYRQSDGSYIIKNAKTGKCLDLSGGSTQNGANIQVWDQNSSDAQKWELIPCGNGYQIKAKCTDCVMEMNAWSFYQGVNCVSGSRDGSDAEIFAINKRDFNTVGKTELSVNTSGADTVFTWGNAWCSTAYNIQIYRGTGTSGSPAISLWNVQNNSFTYRLDDGTYTAYLECFNALGDYVNSTPVTFEKTLNPSGYVDVGTNFYASISHIASGKYATTQTNGNVNLCSDTNIANQYWKFFRQNDGSYKIKSAFSGKCLEVESASTQDGSNIQVNDENTSPEQSWYIYPCGNGYQLKAKCTACVMKMNAWSFYEGVNLVSGGKDGSGAEIFAINVKDFNDIGKTNLDVKCKDGKAIFTWGDARCSTAYNIQIWRGNSASGERAYSLWNVKNNSFTYSLDEGTYTAYIECFNAFSDYVNSSPVTFKVANYNSLIPSASIEYNGHTYEFYNHTYTWYEAYLACEKLGGHLVTITSQEENEKVVELVNGACACVWLGATKLNSDKWYWVNSEPYTENNFWASGEPNDISGNEPFINLYASGTDIGRWNDISGNNENAKGFVCEYDDDIIADNYAPSQMIEYNGYRYELFDYCVDWQTAKRICEKKGGTLADITNAEQQELIWNLTQQGNKAEYWIGLTDINDGGVWKWVTGKDSSYNNWKPGTPDYDLGVESYGLIKKDDGTWNDLKGYAYAYHSIGFICKTPLHTIGDTNLDGYITISDVTSIQRYLAELAVFNDEQLALADTNGDGEINIADATHLQMYLAEYGVVLGKQ